MFRNDANSNNYYISNRMYSYMYTNIYVQIDQSNLVIFCLTNVKNHHFTIIIAAMVGSGC